jgi:hypothetical protein
MMKLFRDYIEFRKRTKPIRDGFDLTIDPDFDSGIFLADRLDELKQYCLENPQYHIMSILQSAVEVNAPISSASFYILADGDADPGLCYTNPMTQEQLENLKICEFDRDR